MKLFRNKNGFSLVEVTIALGIGAFCLIAIFGLLPVGLTSNRNSVEQTKAAGVATAVFTDLRTPNPAKPSQSPRYGFDLTKKTPQTLFTLEDGSLPPGGGVGA